MLFGKLRGYKKVDKVEYVVDNHSHIFPKLLELTSAVTECKSPISQYNLWYYLDSIFPGHEKTEQHWEYQNRYYRFYIREGTATAWKESKTKWVKK